VSGPNTRTRLIVPAASRCGCGSGRAFGECCLRDNRIIKTPHSINPPPPQTGKSIRKCFLHRLQDCDGGISGDHILSRAVLAELLNTKVNLHSTRISGEFRLDSDTLKTNSLCRRHNSAFSRVDSEAARFVRAFRSIHNNLSSGLYDTENRVFLFSGIDIERWLIKTIINIFR
jgi:hypothetical protein